MRNTPPKRPDRRPDRAGNRRARFERLEDRWLLSADLAFGATAAPVYVHPGDPVFLTITLENSGDEAATNLTLLNAIPAGTTFGDASAPAGFTVTPPPAAGGSVQFHTDSFAPGTTASFSLLLQADSGLADGDRIVNTTVATTDTPNHDGVTYYESVAPTWIFTTDADLDVDIRGPLQLTRGAEGLLTITVRNEGTGDARKIGVYQELPAGTRYVAAGAPAESGFSVLEVQSPVSGKSGYVMFTAERFDEGAEVQLEVALQVDMDFDVDYPYLDPQAAIACLNDVNNQNDEAFWRTEVLADDQRGAQLLVTNLPEQDVVLAGGDLSYAIEVMNWGPSTAREVLLTSTLPDGTTLVSAHAPEGWQVSAPAPGQHGTVSFTGDTLRVEQGAHFTVTVRVDADYLETKVSSTARASGKYETFDAQGQPVVPHPDAQGGSDGPVATAVRAQADLSITASALDPEGLPLTWTRPGATWICRLALSNAGPSAAQAVEIQVTLADGLTLAGTPDIPGFDLQWLGQKATLRARSALGPTGESPRWIDLPVEVAAGASGSLTSSLAVRSETTDNVTDNDRFTTPPLPIQDALPLGTVGLEILTGIDPGAAGILYAFEPRRDGWLTVEASSPTGSLALYDLHETLLASSRLAGGKVRLDYDQGRAGQTYLLELRDEASGVALKLANLVAPSDSTIEVFGTDQADSLLVDAPARTFSIHGLGYALEQFPVAVRGNLAFTAQGSGDSAEIEGTEGSDHFELFPQATSTWAGGGWTVALTGATTIRVRAGGTERDAATLHDTAAVDAVTVGLELTSQTDLGGSYYAYLHGFRTINAQAEHGQYDDFVQFNDSPGDDVLIARRRWATQADLAGSYTFQASGFGTLRAHATAGGTDGAILYGTDARDIYLGTAVFGQFGCAGDFLNQVYGYDTIVAIASTADDLARVYGSGKNDQAVIRLGEASFQSGSLRHRLSGFSDVRITAGVGGSALATFRGGLGPERFTGKAAYSELQGTFRGSPASVRASGFREVRSYAGHDNSLAQVEWPAGALPQVGVGYRGIYYPSTRGQVLVYGYRWVQWSNSYTAASQLGAAASSKTESGVVDWLLTHGWQW